MPDEHKLSAQVKVGDEEMTLVPASVSQERVNNLGLPQTGSENVSHLLVPPPNLPKETFDDERDYRPEDAVEWVIDIAFEGDPVFPAEQFSNLFDSDWLLANGNPTVFGWSPEINRWTYLVSSDAPKSFTKLALGWQLFKSYDPEYRVTKDQMERFLNATRQLTQPLGKPTLTINRPPEDAERIASELRNLVERCDRDVVVYLKAPARKPFDGKEVWDVMQCLGLTWGDGDLFHWDNDSSLGDDTFFTIQTTTAPGYFLPEYIAAGKTQLGDLVFVYSIPRSAEPAKVFDSMIKAIGYAQQRLGGEILDEDGMPLNEAAVRSEIRTIVEQLRAAGFQPGAGATCFVF